MPRRARLSVWLLLFKLPASVGSSELKLDTMTAQKRHDLQCFIKQRLMKDGSATHCCLPEDARRSTCAMVSNSGALLLRQLGQHIDTHPFAIRMNDAPFRGYEKHVGSKASIRAGWNVHPKLRPKDDRTETYSFCNDTVAWKTHLKLQRSYPGIKLNPLRCSHDSIVKLLKALYPNRLGTLGTNMNPSTGAAVMFVALSSCAEIVAYEMVPSSAFPEASHHYYGDYRTKKLRDTGHAYWEAEHDLWARLSHTPLSKIKSEGKAEILGLPSVNGCSNESAKHPGFRTPYFVDTYHAQTWKQEILHFEQVDAEHRRSQDAKRDAAKRQRMKDEAGRSAAPPPQREERPSFRVHGAKQRNQVPNSAEAVSPEHLSKAGSVSTKTAHTPADVYSEVEVDVAVATFTTTLRPRPPPVLFAQPQLLRPLVLPGNASTATIASGLDANNLAKAIHSLRQETLLLLSVTVSLLCFGVLHLCRQHGPFFALLRLSGIGTLALCLCFVSTQIAPSLQAG